MKKNINRHYLYGLLLTLVFVFTTVLFGAESVLADSTRTVTVTYDGLDTSDVHSFSTTDKITYTASTFSSGENGETFKNWTISGSTYTIIAGSLKETSVSLEFPAGTSNITIAAHYDKSTAATDISKISNPLSHLKSISISPSSIQKGGTTNITLSFDKSYTNGKIYILLYNEVADGSLSNQTKIYGAGINGKQIVFEGVGSDLYGGKAHLYAVKLFATGTVVTTSTFGTTSAIDTLGSNAAILSKKTLTISGGDPVKKIVIDKGTVDQGTTTTGTAAKAGAKGSSFKATEKAITTSTKEEIATAEFAPLKAYSKKSTKNSITLCWSGMKGATSYIVYGNKCGKKNKFKKIKETSATKLVYSGLKKGTYYKFIVVAVKGNEVLSTSRTVHMTTTGGKYTNYKKITPKKTKITLSLSGKKTYTLGIKSLTKAAKGKAVKKHRTKVWFEDDNPGVIKFGSNGKITAKKKGTAYIYAYTQNGVFKTIKVTVKS